MAELEVASRLVYTAITRGHAALSLRPDCPDTDFVCFTDAPGEYADRTDWEIRPIEAPSGLSPRMQAKFHKLFPPKGYRWNIWVDGAYVLRDQGAEDLVDDVIARSPSGFGLHRHHARDCIYSEAEHSLTLTKCEGLPLKDQVRHYWDAGHPRHWGLWAGGFLCRDDSTRVQEIMRRWWNEIFRWSWRDQISLPFVLRSMQCRPDDWPWKWFQNPYTGGWKFNPI